jgi:HSP20 family protein
MKLLHRKAHQANETTEPTETTTESPATVAAAPTTSDMVVPAATETAPAITTFSQWFDTAFADLDAIEVDERREGDELVIRAELPGIDPAKDVEVRMTDGMLRIHGEHRDESTSEDEAGHRTEVHFGSFTRVLPLPSGVTTDDVKAAYKDGVLEVRVPVHTGGSSNGTVTISS